MAHQADGGRAVVAVSARRWTAHTDQWPGCVPSRSAPMRTVICIWWRGEPLVRLSCRVYSQIGRSVRSCWVTKAGKTSLTDALLGAEAAADAGLDHPDLRLLHLQGIGEDAPDMEGHLGGADHSQAPVFVQVGRRCGRSPSWPGCWPWYDRYGSSTTSLAASSAPHRPTSRLLGAAEVAAGVGPHIAEGRGSSPPGAPQWGYPWLW